jgi:putative NADH-flavin reductase
MGKIVVVGASRGIGAAVVAEALSRGHEVAALARRQPAKVPPKVTWLTGDARDGQLLDLALKDADAVVMSIGMGFTRKPVHLFSDATEALIASMARNAVRRLVAVTGIGAGDTRGYGGFIYDRIILPKLMATIYRDKENQEDLIRATDLEWTIVRPGFLTNRKKTGRVQAMIHRVNYRRGTISRADVADFIMNAIEQGKFVRQSPLIVRKSSRSR